MIEISRQPGFSSVGMIPIHFDVPTHYLPLETFVQTAYQARHVIDDFNDKLFEGQLEYQILVFPPNAGSFKTKLGIAIIAGWGAVFTFTESEVGKAFVKGLTKQKPAYWAEKVGSYLQDKLNDELESISPTIEDTTLVENRYFETLIITESTKSFFQTDEINLRAIGISPQKFREAYEARNKFYQTCAADAEVRALGFNESESFPIKRRDFLRLQVAIPAKEQPAISLPWTVEIVALRVTSPNWDRQDQHRQWKARDSKGRERYFRIEDQQFWDMVQAERLNPHIIDDIKIQWAYVGPQRSRARVLRVLEYNGQFLGTPLDENALQAILGLFDRINEEAPDLFGR